MNIYEKLLDYAQSQGLCVKENHNFRDTSLDGFIYDDVIALSNRLETQADRACILAEEIAHFKVNAGDISNLNIQINRNREERARREATAFILPFMDIVRAVISLRDDATYYNVAKELGVTESFLKESIAIYSRQFSGSFDYLGYHITISPFRVREINYYF